MLYLVWLLINLALFVLLLYLAYQAVRLVRQQFGLAAAVLLVVGLLSFVSNPDAEKQTNALPLQPAPLPEGHNQQAFSAVVAKNPVFNTDLTINCNLPASDAPVVPATASSYLTGFVTGFSWQPLAAVADVDSAAQSLHYQLHGILKWKLLGMQVYAQSKYFKGTIPVR